MKKASTLGVLIIGILFLSQISFAQKWFLSDSTSAWRRGVYLGAGLNQVSLTNWAAGGQNSIAYYSFLYGKLTYTKNRWKWDNTLDLAFGQTKIGDQEWRKNDDRLVYNSALNYSQTEKLSFAWLVDFRTQFADGFNFAKDQTGKDSNAFISTFMAPGYVTSSIGMEYKPNSVFSVFYSPIASKFTFVLNDTLSAVGAFGVEKGERMRSEILGTSLVAKLKLDVMKNVFFNSQLTLFSNYDNMNIDVFWDNILVMKVNEILQVNFSTNLIYDDDINVSRSDDTQGPAIQFKQSFSLGLSMRIGDEVKK